MMWKALVLLSAAVLVLQTAHATPVLHNRAPCGSCHPTKSDEGFMNVHLIPHSHDDVGWLKTVEQYFYGQENGIYVAAVKEIIDTVVEELLKKPERRFIYVETAFLTMWWKQQNESTQAAVRGLVASGQLEIISGAWSMHDEAVTHYHSIIDQFTWGFNRIDAMFDLACAKPHVGWQIDPFGHSRETASLLAMLDFDGVFFARLDKDDRARRIKDKEMEFVWQASASLGNSSRIFTSAFYRHYSAPSGFCFDLEHCNDAPIIEDPNHPDYNVQKKVEDFLSFVASQRDTFQTNHMLVTMGDDFTYQQASSWFDNIDLLIKHVNAEQATGSKVNLLYSTPSCYLNAVHQADKSWTVKTDDFFPYADGAHSYWTGYYTSRPTQKFMERKGNNFLQICKQLSVLADLRLGTWNELDSLREAMGVMQHHDAITGTEKQHVADDYARMLHSAMSDGHVTAEKALNKLVGKNGEAAQLTFHSCLLSNISQCDVTEQSANFVVTLYNPLAQQTSQYVRLPVQNFKYVVFQNGSEVTETQMLKIPTPVTQLPFRESAAEQELIFRATIPALGFTSYYVTKTDEPLPPPTPLAADQKFKISNNKLELVFDPETGLLKSMLRKGEGRVTYEEMGQNFYYYKSKKGDILDGQKSGAYIFRPDGDAIPITDNVELESFSGALVQEVHQKYSEWVSQVIRLYADTEYVEYEWMIGSIPMDEAADKIGKEVITRYWNGPFEANGVFFTDSNGREILQRKRNFRPTWQADIKEAVAGNYYPLTTVISTRDATSEFGVLVDRAQGGTSLEDGVLEIMLHRRLSEDDGRGVGEPLNETQYEQGLVARGKHLMYLAPLEGTPTPVAKQRRWSRDNLVLYPWAFFTSTQLGESDWSDKYTTSYTGLQTTFPDNINLLTLEPWNGDEILVRYEHFYERNDDSQLSTTSYAPTQNLITRFGPEKAIVETTLGGNKWITDSTRLQFKVEATGNENAAEVQENNICAGDSVACSSLKQANITMNPMQIRTFIVKNSAEMQHDGALLAVAMLALLQIIAK